MPFIEALTKTEGLMAVFSGYVPYQDGRLHLSLISSRHDHGDTWCYKWDTQLPGMSIKGNGISKSTQPKPPKQRPHLTTSPDICFGQHSGYGGYGSWTRGARQILISETSLPKREINTWIRLETGDKVGSVTLNSTYGQDVYPETPDTHTSCPTCNYTVVSNMPGTK